MVFTLAQLPHNEALFMVNHDEREVGIGTAREIRDLVAEGIFPDTITMTPVRS